MLIKKIFEAVKSWLPGANKQEILEMANLAARHGATHGERRVYAVFFYRIQGNNVERCFAEWSPSDSHYHWIWEPSD